MVSFIPGKPKFITCNHSKDLKQMKICPWNANAFPI
jgi:hypothetical protein